MRTLCVLYGRRCSLFNVSKLNGPARRRPPLFMTSVARDVTTYLVTNQITPFFCFKSSQWIVTPSIHKPGKRCARERRATILLRAPAGTTHSKRARKRTYAREEGEERGGKRERAKRVLLCGRAVNSVPLGPRARCCRTREEYQSPNAVAPVKKGERGYFIRSWCVLR